MAINLSNNDPFLLNYLGMNPIVILHNRFYTIIPPSTDECPICREIDNDGSEWCQMNGCETIQHVFHVKCIEAWWHSAGGIKKCAICRATAIEKV